MFGMHRNRLKKVSFRRICQLCSAAILNGYIEGFKSGSIFTGSSKAICVPVLNCYSCPGALGSCPIGALQASGAGKYHFPFYVLGFLMLIGVLFGRVVCGFICPFGFIQDLLHKIPSPALRIPEKIDRIGRYLKYVILVFAVLLMPVVALYRNKMAVPYFCKYICPAGTLEGGVFHYLSSDMIRNMVGGLFHWKMTILILIIIFSVLVSRPFCKYFCPLGAFYGLFSKVSFFQLKIEKEKCSGCKACERSCPMNIKVTEHINSAECIHSGKCKDVCPEKVISVKKYTKTDI